MWASTRQRARGAALVETAVAIFVFLLVVLGLMQLVLAYLQWNLGSEAARAGARYAIVNAPLAVLADCPGGADTEVDCGSTDCGGLLTPMQRVAPGLAASQINVRYTCSTADDPALPQALKARAVSVTVSGIEVWALGFGGARLTLPAVSVTRTGEDLDTP